MHVSIRVRVYVCHYIHSHVVNHKWESKESLNKPNQTKSKSQFFNNISQYQVKTGNCDNIIDDEIIDQ